MIIREGFSQIYIPDDTIASGPGTKRVGFYNPDQVLNRDITVAVVNALKPRNYLDGFGGTGIRGIRITRETGTHSVVSEINSKSAEVIEKNMHENDVDLEVRNEPFESVVSRSLFDFIDVDPYGSIVPYLDVALTHVKNGGYLGLTATDLSALTGSAPGKTRRRYDAKVENDRLRHETGVRLFLAYISRRAAALDKSIEPLVTFWKSHYYRTIVRVKQGAGRADRDLTRVRKVNKNMEIGPVYENKDEGPIWTGKLGSGEFIDKVASKPVESILPKSGDFLKALPAEDLRIYFFETADYASFSSTSIPRLDRLSDALGKQYDVNAYRTHFSPTGLKVDLKHSEFLSVFESIATK